MGLDMYLDKELYVSEYSKADKEILPKFLTEQAKLGRNWYYEYRASW